jgi:hypothetical protein
MNTPHTQEYRAILRVPEPQVSAVAMVDAREAGNFPAPVYPLTHMPPWRRSTVHAAASEE